MDESQSGGFQPRIIGFLCNWCSYAGADLAGVSRIQYPPNFRAIRVMCSGRVDPVHIFTAFEAGWDGVMVLGCHFGDCHYISGNYEAELKVQATAWLLEKAGLDPGRLYVDWVSAGEGQRFADLIRMFVERIASLGPLGEPEGLEREDLLKGLAVAKAVSATERIRWLIGRKREIAGEENVLGKVVEEADYDALLREAIDMEYKASGIVSLLQDKALSVTEIAGEIDLSPREIFSLIVELERQKKVELKTIEGRTPKYTAAHA